MLLVCLPSSLCDLGDLYTLWGRVYSRFAKIWVFKLSSFCEVVYKSAPVHFDFSKAFCTSLSKVSFVLALAPKSLLAQSSTFSLCSMALFAREADFGSQYNWYLMVTNTPVCQGHGCGQWVRLHYNIIYIQTLAISEHVCMSLIKLDVCTSLAPVMTSGLLLSNLNLCQCLFW